MLVTVGGTAVKVNRSAALMALVPPAVVTVTSTVPVPGAVVAVIEVALLTVNDAAAEPPKFTFVTPVKFGNTAVAAGSVVLLGPTQIAVIGNPPGTGTVDVTVTTANGTSPTSVADQFTYVAVPTVTGVSPGTGSGAGGTSVTITGTNFTGVTNVNFGGFAAASFTVNSATSITATTAAGTGTVHVTVTTAGGTSTMSAADQFTYTAVPPQPAYRSGRWRHSGDH